MVAGLVLMESGHELVLLHIDYGQVTAKAERRAIELTSSDWSSVDSLSVEIPDFRDYGAGTLAGGVGPELFPHRNLLIVGLGSVVASHYGAAAIALGVINIPEGEFPDCRAPFLDSLRDLLRADSPSLRLELPLAHQTKTEVVDLGIRLGLRIEHTFSCNTNPVRHCGKCVSCRERTVALDRA